MITLTRPEARYILNIATNPVTGGLPLALSVALGLRITAIQEAELLANSEDRTLDTDTIEIPFDPFTLTELSEQKDGIKFGQEWFTGAMLKMFDFTL